MIKVYKTRKEVLMLEEKSETTLSVSLILSDKKSER